MKQVSNATAGTVAHFPQLPNVFLVRGVHRWFECDSRLGVCECADELRAAGHRVLSPCRHLRALGRWLLARETAFLGAWEEGQEPGAWPGPTVGETIMSDDDLRRLFR